MAPATSAVRFHQPAEFGLYGGGICRAEKRADRFGRLCELRVLAVDLDPGKQARDMALIAGPAQRALQCLHEQVSDTALAVGDADIERHRRDAIARKRLAHEYLANHRTVAVRDDQLVVLQQQRQQRSSGTSRYRLLLVGGPFDVLGVSRVAADRDQQTIRDREHHS